MGAITNRPTPREVGDLTTGPTRADAENRMFKDLDPSMRAWALDRITPLKGALNPETWQNGPVTEEDEWFARGITLTDVATCDTFTR